MILMISSWISGKVYFSLLLVLHYSYMISKYWVTLCLWIQNCHKITWQVTHICVYSISEQGFYQYLCLLRQEEQILNYYKHTLLTQVMKILPDDAFFDSLWRHYNVILENKIILRASSTTLSNNWNHLMRLRDMKYIGFKHENFTWWCLFWFS
jgi:hypothetical protein